jgi:preprotein translocase subunit SecY
MNWLIKLQRVWHTKEVRNDILFVLLILVIFRIGAHIPIPGIDTGNLRDFFASNQILGLINLLSGGGLENFSIMMLGVGPYITSSIIFQLLVMIVPKFEELSKEGESGQRKINQYTRWTTIPLAILQGYAFISLLQRQGGSVSLIGELTMFQYIIAIVSVTAGTMLLTWMGDLISERHVGNGVSLLIFAGIVAGLPIAMQQLLLTFDITQLTTLILFLVIAIITVVGVVFITEGQRNIPVTYARRVQGSKQYGGTNTHLPLRVNQGGVIPIIFAISVIIFPSMIAQFFVQAKSSWLANVALYIVELFNNQIFYGVFYFILVIAFTYFYSAVIFKPEQVAENLQKQGGFIPGIRPGRPTVEYLQSTVSHINLTGSLFLGIIAVMPLVLQAYTGMQALVIGGTSLLIVVSVVIETVKKVEAQLEMHEYDAY